MIAADDDNDDLMMLIIWPVGHVVVLEVVDVVVVVCGFATIHHCSTRL